MTGLVIFTIGFLITFSARLYLSSTQTPQTEAVGAIDAIVEVALKLSLVLIPILFIKLIHREPLNRFGIAAGKTPFKHLAIGASTALLWLFLNYLALLSIFGFDVITIRGWTYVQSPAWLFQFFHLLTLNSIGEEIESRAYLQSVFSRATSIRGGIAVSAVLFGVGHVPINLYIYHSSAMTTVFNVTGAAIFGVVAGYLYAITGNILASISLHSVWNVMQVSLPLQIDIPTSTSFIMYVFTGAASLIILFIILALLILLHRRKPHWLVKSEAT